MSKLKPKNLSTQDESGAASLPGFMQDLKYSETAEISTNKLSPADENWNFYKPLSLDKMEELMLSIKNSGLIHPILLWQKDKNKDSYIILSGHNRVGAYKKLYDATLDSKYKKILAQVKTGLSDSEAKEVIIDSNWVQRTLSTSERTRSIYEKYILLKSNETSKNYMKIYDSIADDYSLSGKQIRRYLKLNNLIPVFLEMLDNQEISLRAAVRLANYNKEVQKFIYNLMKDYNIKNKDFEKLRKDMTKEEIKSILLKKDDEMVSVSFEIPKKLQKDFLKFTKSWLDENS